MCKPMTKEERQASVTREKINHSWAMMKPHYQHIPVEYRGFEFVLEVYYSFTESQYSDELQGCSADFDVCDLHHPERARPISARLSKALIAEYHNSIHEQLVEDHV